MINKLVVDGQNITLNESTILPFTYTFSTAGVHNVRVGLDNTNEICAYAFKDCENLTNVVSIPERITMIKRNAFENCSNLVKFNVPSSIEYVGPNVFDGCISLKELKFNTNTPPRFFSNLSDNTTCYIPDGSKFIKVEDNSELVKDGSVQYYEKNILGGYEEVDFEALDDNGEYYYDNWTTVHDHYNTVEERFRVKPTQIEFLDNGVATTLYGDIDAGEEGDIFPHHMIPENSTNSNIFLFSTNEKILQIDQTGHFTTYAGLLGNANVNVCICTEPDYYGTYAFTQLRFRVRSTIVAPTVVNMEMSFPEDYNVNVSNANIGDTIEFETPTLTGDDNLDATITYESSNEDVVKIIDGQLKVVGAGNATITATYAGDDYHTSASASFDITITIQEEKPEPEQTYTIIFKDGDEVLKTITGPTGTVVSTSDIDVNKEGYTLYGWSEDIEHIDEEHATMLIDAIGDSDKIYYAIWVEEPIIQTYLTPTIAKPTSEIIAQMNFPTEKPIEGETLETSAIVRPTDLYLVYPSSWIIKDNNDSIISPKIIDTTYEYEQGMIIDSTIIVDSVEYTIIKTQLGFDTYTIKFN